MSVKEANGRVAIRLEDVAIGSPFWYRRVAEISLLIDAIILALFTLTLVGGETVDATMRVELWPALAAGLNAIVATLAIIRHKSPQMLLLSALSYGLLAVAVSLLILTTGGVFSPYIALWMLVATFAVLFGLPGLAVMGLLANAYIIWQLVSPATGITSSHLMMFALAVDLPLVVSYIIWHKKRQAKNNEDKEVTQLQQQLSTVATQAEIVISSIADGVVAVDKQGVIQLVNPAAQTLLGWSRGDAVNLQYESVIKLTDSGDQLIEPGKNPIEQVKVTKQPIVNNNLTLISKAGKKMMVSLVVSPMLADNEVMGTIVVFRDITAEKAQEREQAEFVSTASHEMRTPVAAIEGYLGLALNPQTAVIDDKARLYLGKAQEAVQHLGRLFQDLLTVTRADDGRMDQHLQVTDMVAFVGSVAESMQQKAAEKNLKLIFDPLYDKPGDGLKQLSPIYFANIDRDHLREVVANLLENAIKYTKEGEIHVNVTGEDRKVTISVRDSGIGIPREDIPHLFQKFYRVDNSDTREIGGTGLGLYISRRLVEGMRGRIWVESEPSKGSTFFVAVPRVSNLEIRHLQEARAIEELQRTPVPTTAEVLSTSAQSTPVATAPAAEPNVSTVTPASSVFAQPAPESPTQRPALDAISPQPQPAAPPAPADPPVTQQAPALIATPQQIASRAPTITELQAQYHARQAASSAQPITDIYQPQQAPQRGALNVPRR